MTISVNRIINDVGEGERVELGKRPAADGACPDLRDAGEVVPTERTYSYDEALELSGHGKYNIGLLMTLCVGMNAMTLDIFGFSMVVSGAACDLRLEQTQKSILLTMPFLGSIVAYMWGFIADTQGRKKSLVIALGGSFVASVLSAFSFNWIMLAVLKLISSAFSSGVQSIAYALLGESCVQRYKNSYLLIVTSVIMSTVGSYMLYAYLTLRTDFSLNIGFITFTPWRLLALVLASTLGAALVCMRWSHESPKFLLNAGLHDEALDVLKKIYQINGCNDVYPVKKLVLNESSSLVDRSTPLLQSLWQQTAPLFRPPLLCRTLQLFYLTIVVYASNNGFFGWLPFFMKAFATSLSSAPFFNETHAMCPMILSSQSFQDATNETVCKSGVEVQIMVASFIQCFVFTGASLLIALVADRKKMLLISLLLFSSISAVITVSVPERITSIIFFFGVMFNCLSIGVIFSYFVDLYPTSYRGMAASLGIMAARTSAIVSVRVIGAYIVSHCTLYFYALAVFIASGVLVSFFLPPDSHKKNVN